jgi:hypothetical protein
MSSTAPSTAHLPATEITIADPESAASLRISFSHPRPIRAGGGGGGTWRSIQAKLFRSPSSSSFLPISIAPIHPAVFLDGGLRSFDDDSAEQSSFLLSLSNLQRSPQLFLTLARIVEACAERLREENDLRPLSFPNPLWMRVDSTIRNAPYVSKTATTATTMEPLSFFRKRSGFYFLKLQVLGLHLPANSEKWHLKIRVADFMLTEAATHAPSEGERAPSLARIQAPSPLPPLPLGVSSGTRPLPPPPSTTTTTQHRRRRKVARMQSSRTDGGGVGEMTRDDREGEVEMRLPPPTQPLPSACSSDSDADDE